MSTATAALSDAPTLPAQNRKIHIPDFELGDRITREQAEFIDTYGFIRFKRFATKEQVRELNEEIDEIDRRLIAEGRTQVNGIPLVIGKKKDGTRYVQRMVFASTFGPKLHAFLQDRRYAAIVDFAGPGFRIGERERDGLVVNTNRNEEGSSYKQLGWHTDSLRDLFYLEKPRRYLNTGFYLTDSPAWRGGVRLIPCSHKQGVWPMLTRKAHFMDVDPDADEYALEAEAGDLTFHDGRIWHRVARASVTGDLSQRRVMYVPLMEGPLKLKHEKSSTPLYFRLKRLARF